MRRLAFLLPLPGHPTTARAAARTKAHRPMHPEPLIVVLPFRGYQRGDRITDPLEIDRVLACDEAIFVVRVFTSLEQ